MKLTTPSFWSSLISSSVLVVFVLLVELLFAASKESFTNGLTLSQKLLLLSEAFSVALFAAFFFFGTVHLVASGLKKMGARRISAYPLYLAHALLFVVFTTCNYFFVERWTYSVFLHNMTHRSPWLNLVILIFVCLVGIALYLNNDKKINIAIESHKKVLSVIFGVVFMVGIVNIIRIYYENAPQLKIANFATMSGNKLPNIIILSYDMFETTHTPLMGYPRNTTPQLFAHRDDFFVFSQATAIGSDSRAGTLVFFNSKSPVSTRVFAHPDKLQGVDVYEHVPRILLNLGYYTLNYGREPYSNPIESNMLGGFSEVNKALINNQEKTNKVRVAFPVLWSFMSDMGSEYKSYLDYTFKRSGNLKHRKEIALVQYQACYFPEFFNRLTSLAQNPKPFFAHLHSTITHRPFYKRKYHRFSNVPDAETPQCIENFKHLKDCDGAPITEAMLLDMYDDAILELDDQVAEVITFLKAKHLYENTLLIITTDHEYRWQISGHPVTLMMHVPGLTKGRIIDAPVSVLDIAPTMVDILGVRVPSWMEGVSLMPLMTKKGHFPQDRFFHLFRGANRKPSEMTVVRYPWRVLQNQDLRIAPICFDLSQGYREKAKSVSCNQAVLAPLIKESVRVIEKIKN